MKIISKVALCMSFATFALLASFADTESVGGYTWTYRINGDTAEIFNNFSAAISPSPTSAVTIPSTLGGKPVTSIRDSAFSGCSGLTSVTIPDSVTSIMDYAFYGCSGLTSVTIGDGVPSIEYGAFYGCSGLTTFVVGDGNPNYKSVNGLLLSKDGKLLVAGVNGDVTIPNSVTSIWHYAFWGCSGLTSVTIPNSVTSIGYGAFYDCSGLTSVTIPNSVRDISSHAFAGCSGLTSVTIPEGVTNISYSAFGGSGVRFVKFSGGLMRLSALSFGGDEWEDHHSPLEIMIFTGDAPYVEGNHINLEGGRCCIYVPRNSTGWGVDIPGTWKNMPIEYIDEPVFTVQNGVLTDVDLRGTTDVTIPDYVTAIGPGAFSNRIELLSVTIPNSVTNIGENAFWGCISLSEITVPNSVQFIGYAAFSGCSGLTSVTIPASVTSIGSAAFSGCNNIREATVPGSKCGIPFDNVTNLTISAGTTSIGESAFWGCPGLMSVSIPGSVVYIDEDAFGSCCNLSLLTIEKGFRYDADEGFDYGSTNLTSIQIADLAVWCENASYIRIRNWQHLIVDGKEVTDLVIPDSVTNIENDAFEGCSGLTSVTVPNSVSNIGMAAFGRCANLTSVTIDNGVVAIGSYAFSSCSGLASVTIPNSVTNIGKYAFSGTALTTVYVSFGDAGRVKQMLSASGYDVTGVTFLMSGLSVTNVVAQQRYPWNGLVDITCRVSGIEGTTSGLNFVVSAVDLDSNTTNNVSHLWVVQNGTKTADYTVRTNGEYRLVWDARSDLGEVVHSNMIVSVSLVVVENVHEGVQLWEDGPYWAETNIGGEKPWDFGYYFWWGDTVGYKRQNDAWVALDGSSYNFSFNEWCAPTYCKDIDALQSEGWIVSQGDAYVLAPEHDAAQVQWGGDWRMPTYQETYDMYSKCDWTWTSTNGVTGYIVRGRDAYVSNSIFLPCAGAGSGTSLSSHRSYGYYWSSVPDLDNSDYYSRYHYFYNRGRLWSSTYRYKGYPIRPVQGFATGEMSAAVVNAGDPAPFLLDTTDGPRASNGSEMLTFSSLWDGNDGATVTIAQDGAALAEGLTDEGEHAWSVTRNGTYVLTHTTYTNGVAGKVEMATFVVTGKDIPFPVGDVTVSNYSNKFDGAAHGLGVKVDDGITGVVVKYATVETGPFVADAPTLTDVGSITVWCEIAAPGYITQTNSATITITKATPGGVGGEEPGSGVVPTGGESKFDVTVMYDGKGHTIDTNALTEAFDAAMVGENAVVYALDDGSGPSGVPGSPALPWGAVPVYTNVGEHVVWYRVANPNYEEYVHAAKLTITKRPVTLTSKNDTKVYDGTPLTAHEVVVGGDGFVGADGATYSFTGSQTERGASKNAFSYTLKGGTNAAFYDITKVEGDLEVTAADISQGDEADWAIVLGPALTYTGLEQIQTLASVEYRGLTVDCSIAGNAQTDAGSYTMTLTGQGNFSGTRQVAWSIAPKALTLTAGSGSRVYDGTAFTIGTVTAVGFVAGEGAIYQCAGSQKDVGTSTNEVSTIGWSVNTKASNYAVTLIAGTLTITARPVTVTVTGHTATYVYDGTEKVVDGFDMSTEDELYDVMGKTYYGGLYDIARRTEVGTTYMGLAASQFANGDLNFAVTYEVENGWVEITSTKEMDELVDAFDGLPVAVAPDGSGGWTVTVTNDISAADLPIEIPDNLGQVTIDLNGQDLSGIDGADGDDTTPGGDGQPAIVIVPGEGEGDPTVLTVVTTGGDAVVKGGDGGDGNPGGDGAPAIAVADGANDGVLINVGEGVTVGGGDGGASDSGSGGNGGAGIAGNVGTNDGMIIGGSGGPSASGAGGNGGPGVDGNVDVNTGDISGGASGGSESGENGSHGEGVTGDVGTDTGVVLPYALADEMVGQVAGQLFTGAEVKPVPDVYDSVHGMDMVEGVDYALSWKDNIWPGIASVTVTGIGDYDGSVTRMFTIGTPVKHSLKAGEYFKATLAELGYDVPTNGASYSVVAYGLPAGLKLKYNAAVTKKSGKKTVVVKPAKVEWWIEGVPTAALDFFDNPPYLVITASGRTVTAPLPIQVAAQEVTELPDLALGQSLNEQFYLPGVGNGWSVSGLPNGLKYTAKLLTEKWKSGQKTMITTNALPYSVYGKTTKAGLFTITAKKKAGAFYETKKFRVLVMPAAVDKALFGEDLTNITTMAYVPVSWNLTNDVSAVGGKVVKVTGLPTGLTFAAKDTYAYKNAKKKTGKNLKQKGQTIVGTPTKPGTYVVTFTKNVKEKVKGKMKTVAKTAQILWVVIANNAELSLGFNSIGGVVESGVVGLKYANMMAFAATSNATVTASGLPAGITLAKLDDSGNYAFTGFTAKAGTYLVTVKATLNGKTVTQRVALKVDALSVWAKGTFNGYVAGEDGATNGLATVTVSAAGKVSGKFYDRGTNWTFTAASYTGYDEAASAYTVPVVAKFAYTAKEKVKVKGKWTTKTVTKYATRNFTLRVGNGALGGTAMLTENGGGTAVSAWQNLWGSTYKALGKKLFYTSKKAQYVTFTIKGASKAGAEMGLTEAMTLTLKVTPAGAVTATLSFATGKKSKNGKAVVYKATCSTVVIPQTPPDAAVFEGEAYLYFAPSPANNFPGFAAAAPF